MGFKNKEMNKLLLVMFSWLAISVSAQDTDRNVKKTKIMKKFELPTLPYPADALAPTISEQTINFHYGKHLQTYINNLNTLIEGTEFENMSIEDIIKSSSGAIFNNSAQTFNHEFYFKTFSPAPQTAPTGRLLAAIDAKWGSLENFKKEFVTSGTSIFGSGWVWLASDADGKLSIIKSANAETPLTQSLKPLLCFDVWEHAYYLDYQNRRADQLNDLWKIVDWKIVETRY